MNIQFPQHVLDFLHSKGFSGIPENWPFQAVELSEKRVYLIFSPLAGYIVTDSDWELASMATVALTQADKSVLRGRCMDLENIKGIGLIVWFFPDGSIQWREGNNLKFVQVRDGSTWSILEKWCAALTKRESSISAKIMGQRQMYTVMRASLQSWISHLKITLDDPKAPFKK